jgi:hypothetical protein
MSNTELATIELSDLARINGGNDTRGGLTVDARSRQVRLDLGHSTSNYATCLAENRRQAREAFPDSRNFFGWLRGDADTNARPRIDFERQGMRNCVTAPSGS